MKYSTIVLLLMVGLSACYYDSEEALYPPIGNNTCDTVDITYTTTVATLINNRCIQCHAEANAASLGGNIKLSTYLQVSSQAEKVVGSVSHAQGYFPMPKGTSKLDDCSIATLQKWLDAGKPQ